VEKEDEKFVQKQRGSGKEMSLPELIYTSSKTEQKTYFQIAHVLILSQILHKGAFFSFFMFSNSLYNTLRYLDNNLSSMVLYPTCGITLKLTF